MNESPSHKMILWFFLALFVLSCMLLGKLLWPFISILVMGAVVSGVFSPLYNRISRKLPPSLASLVTCVVIFLVLFIPIVFFVGILSKEAYDLYLTAKGAVLSDQIRNFFETNRYLEKINPYLLPLNIQITGEQLNQSISEIGKIVGLFLYKQASAIASNTLKLIVNLFFMLLVIYYLFVDKERLVSFIFDLSPLPEEQDVKLIEKFKDMAGAILVGNGVCGLVQGVIGGMVFTIFGLQSPFLWGVVMALLAFLPILGIGLVFLPAAGYLFIKGRVFAAVFFIVFYFFLSGGVEYLLKPKIVGQRVQMHTLIVFLSIIGGLKLFGILGIIYGPLIVTGFLTLTDIYKANYQKFIEEEAG